MPSNTVTAASTLSALAIGAAFGGATAGADDTPPVLVGPRVTAVAAPPQRSVERLLRERCSPLDAPVDHDWNGLANESFPLLGQPCDGPDADAAKCGAYACNDARTGLVCVESEVPRVEWCNGRDDDCNGRVDDGFRIGDGCRAGVGACAVAGRVACSTTDPSQAVCDAVPGEPADEVCCDGVDNDCDGKVDDGCNCLVIDNNTGGE